MQPTSVTWWPANLCVCGVIPSGKSPGKSWVSLNCKWSREKSLRYKVPVIPNTPWGYALGISHHESDVHHDPLSSKCHLGVLSPKVLGQSLKLQSGKNLKPNNIILISHYVHEYTSSMNIPIHNWCFQPEKHAAFRWDHHTEFPSQCGKPHWLYMKNLQWVGIPHSKPIQ